MGLGPNASRNNFTRPDRSDRLKVCCTKMYIKETITTFPYQNNGLYVIKSLNHSFCDIVSLSIAPQSQVTAFGQNIKSSLYAVTSGAKLSSAVL